MIGRRADDRGTGVLSNVSQAIQTLDTCRIQSRIMSKGHKN